MCKQLLEKRKGEKETHLHFHSHPNVAAGERTDKYNRPIGCKRAKKKEKTLKREKKRKRKK